MSVQKLLEYNLPSLVKSAETRSASCELCNAGQMKQHLASSLWALQLCQCFRILAREW